MFTEIKSILKLLYRKNKPALFALAYLVTIIFIALFANIISPFNPNSQILELSSKPPMFKSEVLITSVYEKEKLIPIKKVLNIDSVNVKYLDYSSNEKLLFLSELKGNAEQDWHTNVTFLLGTDRYGRDILSRLIYGSRISISVGLISQSIAVLIGLILGSIAGYYRGFADKVIMWIVNVVWAFPSILLVIAISVVLGKGFWQAFVAIGLTAWVDIARIVRGQVLSIREKEYVESSKALGFTGLKIIIRHIIPNTLSTVFVAATIGLASAMIFEASLSFLGLGVQPPTSSWGQMILDGYKYIITGSNWSLALFPIFILTLTVTAVNILGDGLRDILDPKLK